VRRAEAVVAAARARAAALVAGDEVRLRALHHPQLRWTTYRGEVLDRERYLAGNRPGPLRWVSQTLTGVEVQVVGRVAVLTAAVVDVVERDGTPQTFELRLTQTWVRDRRGWRCLSAHASRPP
jgi:hypothetical protein